MCRLGKRSWPKFRSRDGKKHVQLSPVLPINSQNTTEEKVAVTRPSRREQSRRTPVSFGRPRSQEQYRATPSRCHKLSIKSSCAKQTSCFLCLCLFFTGTPSIHGAGLIKIHTSLKVFPLNVFGGWVEGEEQAAAPVPGARAVCAL